MKKILVLILFLLGALVQLNAEDFQYLNFAPKGAKFCLFLNLGKLQSSLGSTDKKRSEGSPEFFEFGFGFLEFIKSEIRSNRIPSLKECIHQLSKTPPGDFKSYIRSYQTFGPKTGFYPNQLFFFFSSPREFMFLLNGEFHPKDIFADSTLELKDHPLGFAFPGPSILGEAVKTTGYLNTTSMILSSFEPKIQAIGTLSALEEDWPTFVRLVSGAPVLAAEGSFAQLDSEIGSSSHVLPESLRSVQNVRVFFDENLIKLQFYVPDNQARNVIYQGVQEFAKEFQAALKELETQPESLQKALCRDLRKSIRPYIHGSSVFVQLKGPGETSIYQEYLLGMLGSVWLGIPSPDLEGEAKIPQTAQKNSEG